MNRLNRKFQYQQIAQEIEDRILSGELRLGQRLPSERELSEQFSVQRNTVRQALELLERQQHVSTRGRLGSYVSSPISEDVRGSFVINITEAAGSNGAALFDGVVHGARSAGFSVVRTDTEPLPNSWLNRVPDPESLPADTAGVILWPHLPAESDKLRRLNEALPVVLVDHRVTGAEMDCVRFDDVTGGRKLTEHLFALGHRRIAFLTDEVFADSVQARWSGYILAHEYAGYACSARLGLMYQFIDPEILTMTLRHLLADPEIRPTAVICSNDLVAFTLLRILNAEGLRVPKDIAVTGYGNATPEYTSAISLTTVDQPFYEMGVEAARVLAERVRQRSTDRFSAPLDICLPVELVLRGST